MKCRFCGKFFSSNLEFSSLFKAEFSCRKCKRIHEANLLYECIPYQGGIIEYYYFRDIEYHDFAMDIVYDTMIDKPLNLAISQQNEYELILFMEKAEFLNFTKWGFIVLLFNKIMIFSNYRFDFEIFAMLL